MIIDDTSLKRVLGELIVFSARSEILEQEIEQFLNSRDEVDLVRFRGSSERSLAEPRICVEPGETLIEFLEDLRRHAHSPGGESRSALFG